jgi:hypothetical protein
MRGSLHPELNDIFLYLTEVHLLHLGDRFLFRNYIYPYFLNFQLTHVLFPGTPGAADRAQMFP